MLTLLNYVLLLFALGFMGSSFSFCFRAVLLRRGPATKPVTARMNDIKGDTQTTTTLQVVEHSHCPLAYIDKEGN